MWWYPVRIPGEAPSILTGVFRGFPHFLQANARMVFKTSYDTLLQMLSNLLCLFLFLFNFTYITVDKVSLKSITFIVNIYQPFKA